jgi:hypothetical protein
MSTGNYRTEHNCLNCGRHVEEHFCTHCGQENIELRENALHMISHAIADYFHFESKFFGTVKPLLFQPGVLTAQYVAGKRVSFINPIRLYIFISIVFFIVTLSGTHINKGSKAKDETSMDQPKADSLAKVKAAELRETLANTPIPAALKDSLIDATVAQIKARGQAKGKESKGNDFRIYNRWLLDSDSTVSAYENRQKLLPAAKRDNFLKHYIIRRNLELQKYPNAGEKMKEDIVHNIPKMMFILLPLFAVILKLVYFNKNRYYYEHLIYSFHVHSALFLSVLILTLLQRIFGLFHLWDGWLSFLWMIYILWYIYRSLRTFYGSRRWVTAMKFFFLMFSYSIVFTISTIIVIAVTVIFM